MILGIKKLITKYGGTSSVETIDVRGLFSTRPFLRNSKLIAAMKGIPSKKIQVVEIEGKRFVIDGHHRVAEALKTENFFKEVVLVRSDSRRLLEKLQRSSKGTKMSDVRAEPREG